MAGDRRDNLLELEWRRPANLGNARGWPVCVGRQRPVAVRFERVCWASSLQVNGGCPPGQGIPRRRRDARTLESGPTAFRKHDQSLERQHLEAEADMSGI